MAEKTPGVLASFDFLDSTIDAIHELRKAGFKQLRAYAPYPEHHIDDALEHGESPVRVWTLVGGLTGTATGFAFTTWTSMDWPLITGGKPIVSIPAYVVIAFEMTVLFAALTAFGMMLALNGLPRLHHPLFDVAPFARASQDRFFLSVEAADPRFDLTSTRAFLESLEGVRGVYEA